MNATVRKSSEATLCKLYEHMPSKSNLVQPMCNEIQFSQSARLKPILIDHLSGKFLSCDTLSKSCITVLFVHLPFLCRLRERPLQYGLDKQVGAAFDVQDFG